MTPAEIEAAIIKSEPAFNEWKQRRAALKAELAEHPERYPVISKKLDAMDVEHHQMSVAFGPQRSEGMSEEEWLDLCEEWTQASDKIRLEKGEDSRKMRDDFFDEIFSFRPRT